MRHCVMHFRTQRSAVQCSAPHCSLLPTPCHCSPLTSFLASSSFFRFSSTDMVFPAPASNLDKRALRFFSKSEGCLRKAHMRMERKVSKKYQIIISRNGTERKQSDRTEEMNKQTGRERQTERERDREREGNIPRFNRFCFICVGKQEQDRAPRVEARVRVKARGRSGIN